MNKQLIILQSYIDVDDFPSVLALADYLSYLTKNPGEYLKYFEWKKDHTWFYHNPYCTICQKLHYDESVSEYPNITKWFYEDSKGRSQCTLGKERKYYKSLKTDEL